MWAMSTATSYAKSSRGVHHHLKPTPLNSRVRKEKKEKKNTILKHNSKKKFFFNERKKTYSIILITTRQDNGIGTVFLSAVNTCYMGPVHTCLAHLQNEKHHNFRRKVLFSFFNHSACFLFVAVNSLQGAL
jgi:hypothetical protein